MANVSDTKTTKLSVIESVSYKVGKLVEQNRRLTEQCDKLTHRNDRLVRENAEMKATVAGLEQRLAAFELKSGFSGSGDGNKKAQARVNRLMREVDKCIALLNR